ncbi:MAG: SBBP repeat-containing protein [Ignavibacteria bacterium]|nr:SBBP repeat-containing protein [Ignavibacteria bacterium]
MNGTSVGNSNVDYYTIKYDRDGAVKWGVRYNGPANNSDQGSGIAVDRSGNVYSFGESIGMGSGFDWLLVKYNSSGVQLWTKRYNGTANDFDDADDVITDESGNIYVMGASTGANSDLDFLLIKYDSSGAMQWEQK